MKTNFCISKKEIPAKGEKHKRKKKIIWKKNKYTNFFFFCVRILLQRSQQFRTNDSPSDKWEDGAVVQNVAMGMGWEQDWAWASVV